MILIFPQWIVKLVIKIYAILEFNAIIIRVYFESFSVLDLITGLYINQIIYIPEYKYFLLFLPSKNYLHIILLYLNDGLKYFN